MSNQAIPTKLRTGDEVIVIAGKDIGKKGTLREIITVSYTHLTLPTIVGV